MIHFIADLHLGHANIIRHCGRPFLDAGHMDAAIIDAINATVRPDDVLWILGDFAYRGRSPRHYRDRIACRDVRLLLGNHDRRSQCEGAGFTTVGDVAEITIGQQRIWMSHYPHLSWPASHRGSWHLYGHVHGKLADIGGRLMDVGVDACNYRPVSLDAVAAYMESR